MKKLRPYYHVINGRRGIMTSLLSLDQGALDDNPEYKEQVFKAMAAMLSEEVGACDFAGPPVPGYVEARVHTKHMLADNVFRLGEGVAVAMLCRYMAEAVQLLQLLAVNDIVTLDNYMKFGSATDQILDTLDCLRVVREGGNLEHMLHLCDYCDVLVERMLQLVGDAGTELGGTADRDLLFERLASRTGSACAILHDGVDWVVCRAGDETEPLGQGTTPTFAVMEALTTIHQESRKGLQETRKTDHEDQGR